MARRQSSRAERAFVYRGGTRLAGTVVACDARGGSDLLFVSHGRVYARDGARTARLPGGRAQVVMTAETLAFFGPAGERLRSRALLVGCGRPFQLGSARLELLPTGYLPGAAALACEAGGRRMLYAGTVSRQALEGSERVGVRAADAVCIDATFGDPRFGFVSTEAALGEVRRFVRDARATGSAPIILVAPYGPMPHIVAALEADGWRVRGNRAVLEAAAAFRRGGKSVPAIARFAGVLGSDEVLLWPPFARRSAGLGRLGAVRVMWVSGWAADPETRAQVAADEALPYADELDHAGVLAYVEATGAREVALLHDGRGTAAAALRDHGLSAYGLSPPEQIQLFR